MEELMRSPIKVPTKHITIKTPEGEADDLTKEELPLGKKGVPMKVGDRDVIEITVTSDGSAPPLVAKIEIPGVARAIIEYAPTPDSTEYKPFDPNNDGPLDIGPDGVTRTPVEVGKIRITILAPAPDENGEIPTETFKTHVGIHVCKGTPGTEFECLCCIVIHCYVYVSTLFLCPSTRYSVLKIDKN